MTRRRASGGARDGNPLLGQRRSVGEINGCWRLGSLHWLELHFRGPGGVVPQPHPPRAAAHLAVLDVVLRSPARRIEAEADGFAAVRAGAVRCGLEWPL